MDERQNQKVPAMKYDPALHKHVPMGARVRIPDHYLGRKATGTVVGIAALNIVFSYIVLLDEVIQSEYGPQRALVVGGAELVSEDGATNWRL